MKRKWILIAGVLLLAVLAVLGGILLGGNTVRVNAPDKGEAIFRCGGADIIQPLSEQELARIQSIFEGKRMYKDSPSCGFTENVSVRLDGSQTFCLACDTCPVIYWKEENRYFKISEAEKDELYRLLEAHGFSFPCV